MGKRHLQTDSFAEKTSVASWKAFNFEQDNKERKSFSFMTIERIDSTPYENYVYVVITAPKQNRFHQKTGATEDLYFYNAYSGPVHKATFISN